MGDERDWKQATEAELEAREDVPAEEKRLLLMILTLRPEVTLWDTPEGLTLKGIGLKQIGN